MDGRDAVIDRPALEVLLKGVSRRNDSSISCRTIIFSDETATGKNTGVKTTELIKRVSKYHQYWALNAAVESTLSWSRAGPEKTL